jgi:hypothetical protein
MNAVTARLRQAHRRALLALTPTDRVRLALALGQRDLETFRRAHQPPLTPEEARRAIERQRQRGRRASACVARATG